MPISERQVRATIVVACRITRNLRLRPAAFTKRKENKTNAVGMFLDENELLCRVSNFRTENLYLWASAWKR